VAGLASQQSVVHPGEYGHSSLGTPFESTRGSLSSHLVSFLGKIFYSIFNFLQLKKSESIAFCCNPAKGTLWMVDIYLHHGNALWVDS
jgi:hypothetical protein